MCGIAGHLSWSAPPDRFGIERICKEIAHRGPDAHGIYADEHIVLGHRRLSIIDISSNNDQPLVDRDERYCPRLQRRDL